MTDIATTPSPTEHPLIMPTGSEVSSVTEHNWEVEGKWWEEPKYLGPAAAFALLVILLLLFCCLYRLHKRSKVIKSINGTLRDIVIRL